jgi:Anaphase-promoting complex subunit 4 WD40 domain
MSQPSEETTAVPSAQATPTPPPATLDTIERIAKIFSLIAIPIVIPLAIAVYSASVQEGAQHEAINRDYVQLAVSVLKENKDSVDAGLRNWAVDLLAEHSPTKFAPEVISSLKRGDVSLPTAVGGASGGLSITTLSPDHKQFATYVDHQITLSDADTGEQKMVLKLGDTSFPSSLGYSPDGEFLASGSENGNVRVFKVSTGTLVRAVKIPQPVLSVQIESSGNLDVYGWGHLYLFDRNGVSLGVRSNLNVPASTSIMVR